MGLPPILIQALCESSGCSSFLDEPRSPSEGQETFLEGHVVAFERLGVATRIRYDNLKPAVVRILTGRDRIESDRFVALRSHYGFDSFFCEPGAAGAHEKVYAPDCTSSVTSMTKP